MHFPKSPLKRALQKSTCFVHFECVLEKFNHEVHFKLAFVEVHFDMHLASALKVDFCWSVPQSVTRTSMRHSHKTEFGMLIRPEKYLASEALCVHFTRAIAATYTFDIGAPSAVALLFQAVLVLVFVQTILWPCNHLSTSPDPVYSRKILCPLSLQVSAGLSINATDLPRSRVRVFLFCSDFPSSCIAPILILSGKEFRDNIIWYL